MLKPSVLQPWRHSCHESPAMRFSSHQLSAWPLVSQRLSLWWHHWECTALTIKNSELIYFFSHFFLTKYRLQIRTKLNKLEERLETITVGPDWNTSDFINFCCKIIASRTCVYFEFVTLLFVKMSRLGFLCVLDVINQPYMCFWFFMVLLLQIWYEVYVL